MRGIGRLVLSVSTLAAGWVLLGLWQTPPGAERRDDCRLVAQLRHLDSEVERGEPERMQALFPEGYVFTRVLHGLAWASLAADPEVDQDLREEALDKAREAQRDLRTPYARSRFQPDLDPPYGAFYVGWALRLDIEVLRGASEDPTALRAFHEEADLLAAALTRSLDSTGSPFLPSYRRRAWPADGLVGAAALAVHDEHFPPRYEAVLARWREAMRRSVDPESGLLAHAATVPEGAPLGGPRGGSQALTLRFMADADSVAGRAMYESFRERFVTRRLGLAVVTEYPKGATGPADIDSGPIPFGVALPGTVVAIGTARRYGDRALAQDLSQTVEAFGLPLVWRGRRFYAFGALAVGDGFLAWSRTAPVGRGVARGVSRRLPFSLGIVGLLVVGWGLALRSRGGSRA